MPLQELLAAIVLAVSPVADQALDMQVARSDGVARDGRIDDRDGDDDRGDRGDDGDDDRDDGDDGDDDNDRNDDDDDDRRRR